MAPSLFRTLISTLFLLQRVSQTDAAVEKTASDEVITAAEEEKPAPQDETVEDVSTETTEAVEDGPTSEDKAYEETPVEEEHSEEADYSAFGFSVSDDEMVHTDDNDDNKPAEDSEGDELSDDVKNSLPF